MNDQHNICILQNVVLLAPIERDNMKINPPNEIRTSVFKTLKWARRILTDHEGRGHMIVLRRHHKNKELISCSFAKPSWSGDHSGPYCKSGVDAIIESIRDYLRYE